MHGKTCVNSTPQRVSQEIEMLKEFREFALKGNMLDLAIGIILGANFNSIVDSLVKDIIMPPIGLLLGGADFSQLHLVLKSGEVAGPYITLEAAQAAGAVTLNYGAFVNVLVNFIIMAITLFFIVRGINRLRGPEKPAAT